MDIGNKKPRSAEEDAVAFGGSHSSVLPESQVFYGLGNRLITLPAQEKVDLCLWAPAGGPAESILRAMLEVDLAIWVVRSWTELLDGPVVAHVNCVRVGISREFTVLLALGKNVLGEAALSVRETKDNCKRLVPNTHGYTIGREAKLSVDDYRCMARVILANHLS